MASGGDSEIPLQGFSGETLVALLVRRDRNGALWKSIFLRGFCAI